MIALNELDCNQIKYVREDPRLREQEFRANFQTTTLSKSERDQYSRFFFRWPQGESAADVYDRVSVFISSIWRDFTSDQFGEQMGDNGTVIIFTHGLTSRIFLMRWVCF